MCAPQVYCEKDRLFAVLLNHLMMPLLSVYRNSRVWQLRGDFGIFPYRLVKLVKYESSSGSFPAAPPSWFSPKSRRNNLPIFPMFSGMEPRKLFLPTSTMIVKYLVGVRRQCQCNLIIINKFKRQRKQFRLFIHYIYQYE